MKKRFQLFLAALLTSSSMGYAADSGYQEGGWECRYPSAYSFNWFEGWLDDVHLSGTLLYWSLSDEPYEFLTEKKALRNVGTDVANVLLSSKEKSKIVGFGFDPGFRVGIGSTLPGPAVQTELNWTHFFIHGKNNELIQGVADPIFNSFALTTVPEIAGVLAAGQNAAFTGKAKFRYDVIDLEFTKWCCLCDGLRLKPIFGFRYVDIADKTKTDFAFTVPLATNQVLSGRVTTNNNFRGVGIRGGFGVEYGLCQGINVFADVAGSFAWGKSHSSVGVNAIVAGENPITRTTHGGNAGRSFLDGQIGVNYSTCICGDYPVLLALSWEQNYLYGIRRSQVETNPFSLSQASTGNSKRDDLVLSGLSFSIELGF